MKNDEKLKAEINANNEVCDNGNFDVQSKRQAREFYLSLFYNDQSSVFSKNSLE